MKRNAVFLMTALLVALMVSFTSCLNSDSGSSWDYGGYFTKSSGLVSYNYITDDGYKFYISGLDSEPERALMYVKFADGEELTTERVIKATLYQGYTVDVNDFTNRKDTIVSGVNDFAIAELIKNTSSTKADYNWSANGYLNISFKFYVAAYDTKLVAFELIAEDVDEDGVLNARLVQTIGGILPGGNPYATSSQSMACFRLPSIEDLNDILGDKGPVTTNTLKIRIIANSVTTGTQLKGELVEVTLNN